MSEETRREVFGGSGRDQGPGKKEAGEEASQENRDYSGPSRSGSGNMPDHPKST